MSEIFDNINQQEKEAIVSREKEIASINAQIAVTSRVSLVKTSPGWTDYESSIKEMLQRATNELLNCDSDDARMRQQQGRAQALRDILTLFVRGESMIALLAQRRDFLQNELAQIRQRTPKQVTP